MPIPAASPEAIRKISDDLGLAVTATEASEYAEILSQMLPAYDAVADFMHVA